jgi:hypothetical protein
MRDYVGAPGRGCAELKTSGTHLGAGDEIGRYLAGIGLRILIIPAWFIPPYFIAETPIIHRGRKG